MYTTHHCRHCGDKHNQALSPFPKKKIKLDKLLLKVEQYIYDKIKAFKAEPVWKNFRVSKEEIAKYFRVNVSLVEQCLHKLNLNGLINQPVHKAPHDSMRDYAFSHGYYKGKCGDYKNTNGDSAWMADIYYINVKYLQ